MHRGPYDDLGKAHHALAEWARAKGYRVGGAPTEVYLAGPDEHRAPDQPDVDQLRSGTGISVPTYGGHIAFGVTAEHDTAPEVELMAAAIE